MDQLHMDFMTLILSFRATAFALLKGDQDQPADLDAARVQRALLDVIRVKTKGNLSDDEARLLTVALQEIDDALARATQL